MEREGDGLDGWTDGWMGDYPAELGFESTWAFQTLGFIQPCETHRKKKKRERFSPLEK